jgi:hypothetical protein
MIGVSSQCPEFLYLVCIIPIISSYFCIPDNYNAQPSILQMAAESEVSFGELDGSSLQIGVLRTRWNDEHVTNLVNGIKVKFNSITAYLNVLKTVLCSCIANSIRYPIIFN